MNQLETCQEQLEAVDAFFNELADLSQHLIYSEGLAA
jgi:hypothetical protein